MKWKNTKGNSEFVRFWPIMDTIFNTCTAKVDIEERHTIYFSMESLPI